MTARAKKRRVDWDNAYSFSVGALSIDVKIARAHGWSPKQLDRTADAIHRLSRREASIAHRSGPVPKCPCETCDLRVKDADVAEPEGLLQRARWRKRGLLK